MGGACVRDEQRLDKVVAREAELQACVQQLELSSKALEASLSCMVFLPFFLNLERVV